MTPADFRWTPSNPAEPNAAGAAAFSVGSHTVVQHFRCYGDAQRIHALLCAAQVDGLEHGQRSLAQYVAGAVRPFAV